MVSKHYDPSCIFSGGKGPQHPRIYAPVERYYSDMCYVKTKSLRSLHYSDKAEVIRVRIVQSLSEYAP